MDFITTYNINGKQIKVWAEQSKENFADYGRFFLYEKDDCLNKHTPILVRPNKRSIKLFLEQSKGH